MKTRNRFFTAGSIILILTALAHFYGTLRGGEPSNEDEKKVLDVMKSVVLLLPGGMHRTMMDIFRGFGWSYGILTLKVAVINLVILRGKAGDDLFRKILWVNVVFWGLFLIPTILLTILPPMIFFSAAWLCFVMALIFSKPKTIV